VVLIEVFSQSTGPVQKCTSILAGTFVTITSLVLVLNMYQIRIVFLHRNTRTSLEQKSHEPGALLKNKLGG